MNNPESAINQQESEARINTEPTKSDQLAQKLTEIPPNYLIEQ